jgi:hypothetical protein
MNSQFVVSTQSQSSNDHAAKKPNLMPAKRNYAEVASGRSITVDKIVPVFISIKNANNTTISFKNISIHEQKLFRSCLVEQVGEFSNAIPMPHGDLCVHPCDTSQQRRLLNLTSVSGKTVSASLPKSASIVGVISFVGIVHSDEDLLQELAVQGVTKIIRFFRNVNGYKEPTENVKLFFDLPSRPGKVFLADTAYTVKPFFPTPNKCRTCFVIGHVKCFRRQCCETCCRPHDEGTACDIYCINCKSSAHRVSSPLCPAFLNRKAILRYQALYCCSMEQAATAINATRPPAHSPDANLVTSGPSPPLAQPLVAPNVELQALKAQVAKLQSEMLVVTTISIPRIEKTAEVAASSAKSAIVIVKKSKVALNSHMNQLVDCRNEDAKSMFAGFRAILMCCARDETVRDIALQALDPPKLFALCPEVEQSSGDEESSPPEEEEEMEEEGELLDPSIISFEPINSEMNSATPQSSNDK